MLKNHDIKARVTGKLAELQALRPLSANLVAKLREQFSLEMNYNSNAIEGNTLTLRETMLVLQEGITIKNKPLKDHLEAKNQAGAISYLYDIVEKKVPLTEHLVRTLHSLIVQGIDKTEAGSYRTYDVRISGSSHTPPPAFEVSSDMSALLLWYQALEQTADPLALATEFKHRFVAIHPFGDGNGRTSRLLMNIILMRAGLPIVVILKNDRQKYYRALQQADGGKMENLLLFISQAVERSLDIYLKTLAPSTPGNALKSVAEVAPRTPYSAAYISLLIRKGLIAGVKDGRNWKTSLEAVTLYRASRTRKR
jgi:Fic family protein